MAAQNLAAAASPVASDGMTRDMVPGGALPVA